MSFPLSRQRRIKLPAALAALVLLLVRAFKVLQVHWPRPVELLPAYVVGSLGAFWTIQRLMLMVEGA